MVRTTKLQMGQPRGIQSSDGAEQVSCLVFFHLFMTTQMLASSFRWNSGIPFKVSLLQPGDYERTALLCAAEQGRSTLFWFLPIIPGGQFFPSSKPSDCTVAEDNLQPQAEQVSYSYCTCLASSIDLLKVQQVQDLLSWGCTKQCSGLNPTATMLEKSQCESFNRILSELKNVKLKGRTVNRH